MGPENFLYLMLGLAAVVLAAAGTLVNHFRTKRTMQCLDRMVSDAIDGTFLEHTFDESQLSALESKMRRYLSESTISCQNLLHEKEKIKSLISDISHQTKTPISNILLYAQLLAEQELPKEGRRCAEALTAQAEKLSFLISALMKTSRLETGIIHVEPRLSSVQELLDRSATAVLPKAAAKGIDVMLPDTGVQAQFDPKWTAEAIENILDNAVKYSPEGTRIVITVEPYELFCRIDIQDEGIGIAPDEFNQIFQRFYRSPSVARREGVGIGLYLTREILNLQCGYCKVNSEQGKGSVFSVFLPKE